MAIQYSHFCEIHAFAQKGGVLFVVLGTFLSDVRNPRNKAKSACQRAWHLIWSRHTLEECRRSSVWKNAHAACGQTGLFRWLPAWPHRWSCSSSIGFVLVISHITRAPALMMTKSSNLILNLNLILGFFGFLWVLLGYFGFRWVLKKPRKTDWVFSILKKAGLMPRRKPPWR